MKARFWVLYHKEFLRQEKSWDVNAEVLFPRFAKPPAINGGILFSALNHDWWLSLNTAGYTTNFMQG